MAIGIALASQALPKKKGEKRLCPPDRNFQIVCRETEKEARDYLHHYVHEQGDWEAAGNLLKIFGLHNQTLDAKTLDGHKAHFIAGHGGYPLVGTAEQIVDELGKLAEIGVDGCLISWVRYKEELTQWNEEVLPLMVQAGLRTPFAPAARSSPLATASLEDARVA